jgi:hypothetical protein
MAPEKKLKILTTAKITFFDLFHEKDISIPKACICKYLKLLSTKLKDIPFKKSKDSFKQKA